MPPDTGIRPGFPCKDESWLDGRSTTAFGQNSKNQTTRDVEFRSSGRDFKDMSTTHVQNVSANIVVNVRDGATFNASWPNISDTTHHSETDPVEPEAGGVGPFYFRPLTVFKGLLNRINIVLGTQEFPPTAVSTDSARGAAEAPVRAIDISLLPLSLQPSSPTSIPLPAEIYVCGLLRSGYGLPCWDTRPRQRELQPYGVVPGDVGTYSVDRGFRKIFNLRDLEAIEEIKKIAASYCDTAYVPLGGEPTVEEDEISQDTVILSSGAKCSSKYSQNQYKFTFGSSAGGILAVLSAADLVTTEDKEAMRAHIIQHAEPLYRFSSGKRSLKPGDSLYFISGSIKTEASARAAYQSSTDHSRLLQLSRTPPSTYHWDLLPGETYPRYDCSGVSELKNQTLFLQGFKLAISSEFIRQLNTTPSGQSRPEMGGPSNQGRNDGPSTPDNSSQGGGGEGSSQNNSSHRAGARGPQPGGKERSLGTSGGASHGLQGGGNPCVDGEGGIECSQFPPSPENNVYHPCDIINELLLDKTAANFALSHDDDWRHNLRDYGTSNSKNSTNMEAGLPQSSDAEENKPFVGEGPGLSIVVQNGVAYPRTPQGQARSSVTQQAATGKNAKSVERPSKSSREAFDRSSNDVAILKQTRDTADTPQSPPSILDLPDEILGDILLPLPVPAILCSQAVCRKFNSIITSSVETQYRVALEISGLEDNKMCSSLSTSERLEELLKGQKAWRHLKPQFTASTNLQVTSWYEGYSDLRGGLFVMGSGEESIITYAVLPEREGEDVEWKYVDMQEKCVVTGLNAWEHDLIVIMTRVWLEDTRVFEFELHMKQLSTGEPHPEARQPRVSACKGEGDISGYGIEVVGDNLVAHLRFPEQDDTSLPDRLMVFEWKTGTLKASLRAPHGSHNCPIFLEENVLLISNSRRGALEIWDLPQEEPLSPTLVCTLALPLLDPWRSFDLIAAHGEPNPKGTRNYARRQQSPCQLSPKDIIIGFDLFVRPHHWYSFFIHRKSILRIVKACRSRQTAPSETNVDAASGSSPFPAPIPWEQWGEKNAKLVETSNMVTLYVPRSAGQRTVLIPSEASDQPSSMIVMDFNPWTIKKCRHSLMKEQREFKERGEGGCKQEQQVIRTQQPEDRVAVEFDDNNATDEDSSWELAGAPSPHHSEDFSGESESEPDDTFLPGCYPRPGGWVLSETTIVDRGANVFASPVISELPCVCYSSSQRFGYCGVMMDEARILGVKEDGTLDVHHFGRG